MGGFCITSGFAIPIIAYSDEEVGGQSLRDEVYGLAYDNREVIARTAYDNRKVIGKVASDNKDAIAGFVADNPDLIYGNDSRYT